MDWEIHSFDRVGPIHFGMTVEEVEAILGAPARARKGLRAGSHAEFRGTTSPIIRYRDGEVAEMEAFYDLANVSYCGLRLFADDGIEIMQALEKFNGGALETLGIVVFDTIGITTGRLDLPGRENHSITAFKQGLWNDKLDLSPISFG